MYRCNYFNLGVRRGCVVNARTRPLYSWKLPGTHCTVGWVDIKAGLDGCGISRPPPGFDLRTVQALTSRYTGPHSGILQKHIQLFKQVVDPRPDT